jgi:AraC-like DNA-binding protein
MYIESIEPINPLIARFVAYFYFFENEDGHTQSYLTFPHINTPVSFFRHTKVERCGYKIVFSHDEQADYVGYIAGKYQKPLHVTYQGKISEVAIFFKPLGLNQFIRQDYSEIASEVTQEFNPYGEALSSNLLRELFVLHSIDEKVRLFEDFLLKHYVPFENKAIEQALALITDVENQLSIAEIAESVGVSHKTLVRLFQRHLATSPIIYRKIARFRHSLENRLSNSSLGNLTEVGNNSNYYDQAYFIKQYRQLTGDTPTQFYRNLTLLASRKVKWQLL